MQKSTALYQVQHLLHDQNHVTLRLKICHYKLYKTRNKIQRMQKSTVLYSVSVIKTRFFIRAYTLLQIVRVITIIPKWGYTTLRLTFPSLRIVQNTIDTFLCSFYLLLTQHSTLMNLTHIYTIFFSFTCKLFITLTGQVGYQNHKIRIFHQKRRHYHIIIVQMYHITNCRNDEEHAGYMLFRLNGVVAIID